MTVYDLKANLLTPLMRRRVYASSVRREDAYTRPFSESKLFGIIPCPRAPHVIATGTRAIQATSMKINF